MQSKLPLAASAVVLASFAEANFFTDRIANERDNALAKIMSPTFEALDRLLNDEEGIQAAAAMYRENPEGAAKLNKDIEAGAGQHHQKVQYPYNPHIRKDEYGRKIMAGIDAYAMFFYRPVMAISNLTLAGFLCPTVISVADGPLTDVAAGYTINTATAEQQCVDISGNFIKYLYYGGGVDNRGSFWSIDQLA